METVFLNNSRSGWWDIESYAYMYAKIDAQFEYGRIYESSVEYTFDILLSPKGTNVYYAYPIYYDIYANGVKKATHQIKGDTGTSVIEDVEYTHSIGINFDGLSADTTMASWKVVFRSDSGYSCEASGTLTFPAYDSVDAPSNPVYRFQASNLPPDAFPIDITLVSDPECSFTLESASDYYTQEFVDFYDADSVTFNESYYSFDRWSYSGDNPIVCEMEYTASGGSYSGYWGEITFIGGTPPSSITCASDCTGSYVEDVEITITGSTTEYTYGSDYYDGDYCLTFPELSGWTLEVEQGNDAYCNRKNATYTKVISTSGLVKGAIAFTDNSNQYGIRPTFVELKLYLSGTLSETITVDTSSSTTDSFSFAFSGSYAYADVTVGISNVLHYSEHVSFSCVEDYLSCNINCKTNSAWKKYAAYVYTNGAWVKSLTEGI